eukprot:14512357-Alexandrium_andersonii.AAC.1
MLHLRNWRQQAVGRRPPVPRQPTRFAPSRRLNRAMSLPRGPRSKTRALPENTGRQLDDNGTMNGCWRILESFGGRRWTWLWNAQVAETLSM